MFYKLEDGSLEEITGLNKKISLNNLIYRYEGLRDDVKFDEFSDAVNLLGKIKEGKDKPS